MRLNMATVGILGGTGPAGRGVAVRLAGAGYDVYVGSRDAERAFEVASRLEPRGTGKVHGVSNEEAANADLVIVATPADSAIATVSAVAPQLAGKIVISMVNALSKEGREMIAVYPPLGSMAAEIAAVLPESHIAGAFHHLPAAQMEDLDSGIDADVLVFSDDDETRDAVAKMVGEMQGLRAIVAGSMKLAGAIEAFTAVCISVNIRNRAHSYVKMAGMSN
jgi:NADPH-dependent F420 reductase